MTTPIYVTQPSLPPLDEFVPYLERIWSSRILTNGGPLHQELEASLCRYLGVPYISLFNNGTIALVTALQALGLKGEVITTPYTFVATANALVWNGLEPVFIDIDAETCNLNPDLIEAAITTRTSAILAVHCYGTPCDVDAIQDIAARHGLRVIYDAAHAFDVECHCNQSILTHGDLSVLSFHATKVFNTFEGGAVVSQTQEMKARIDQLKNFGFETESTLALAGLNGKMSEIQAAMGLAQLVHIDEYLAQRARIAATYRDRLSTLPGLRLPKMVSGRNNNSYFPVIFQTPELRDAVREGLMEQGVTPRRYFWPLITDFNAFNTFRRHSLVEAARLAQTILCLPIYPNLSDVDIHRITDIVSQVVERKRRFSNLGSVTA